MSENREADWERLADGERAEIGLVQIDIVGHSKIKANERTLKKAKDIFSDEMERIAVAHGGKVFAWAGDGGSYMFLLRDGENFNRLVRAALEMLESMPAVNKKIADETDLKTPIRVRLSCDAGTAEFDRNPTRITAAFINSFIKNEREIGLPDNVCITERVYKQLDSRLRARFTEYKRSPELHSNIYSLPRQKPSLRRAHIVLLILLGLVLGLAVAAACAYFGWMLAFRKAEAPRTAAPPVTSPSSGGARPSPIRMVGSGTVFEYLKQLQVFDKLSKDGKDVSIIDCPTETGAELFAGTSEPGMYLVMASEKLTPAKLRQGEKQWGPNFEIYLGDDPLQVLFAMGSERRGRPSESDNVFLRGGQLTKKELVSRWRDDYDVYATVEGSGTRETWEDYLFGDEHKDDPWPFVVKPWTQHDNQIIDWNKEKRPRIYLGSETLNNSYDGILKSQGIEHRQLTMVDENGKTETRNLYLYGWVATDAADKVVGGTAANRGMGKAHDRYYIPKQVVETLRYVFDALEGSGRLEKECLDAQRDYFHIKRQSEEPEGWVTAYKPHDFYRPEKCKGWVEKPEKVEKGKR